MNVPRVVIALEIEASRASIVLEGVAGREVAARLADWIGEDKRRQSLLLIALELAQPQPGDVKDDEVLGHLAELLGSGSDPYAAIIPVGSLQSKTLRYAVDRLDGETRRAWFAWSLARQWEPQDDPFVAALRRVAAAEFGDDEPEGSSESAGSDA